MKVLRDRGVRGVGTVVLLLLLGVAGVWRPWAVVLGLPVLGAWLGVLWWTRKRAVAKEPGSSALRPACAECGYELRGTLDAGGITCPECGAGVPVGAARGYFALANPGNEFSGRRGGGGGRVE